MKIFHVAGARPNFMKIAPVMDQMAQYPDWFQQVLVHTGQHYDDKMSQVFFDDLSLPQPNYYLGVGSGTHAEQTAKVMTAFEPLAQNLRPDLVLVVGDVNSTLAAALVCAKLGIPVGHIEAGLRSFDRTMPEEINRLITDQIADLLFTPSPDANTNLEREGISPQRIHFVGNVMIDTLVRMLPKARQLPVRDELGLKPKDYVLVTLHRPFNVDDPVVLKEILLALRDIAHDVPVIFPIHPRTRQRFSDFGLDSVFSGKHTGVRLLDPLGYLEFLALMSEAAMVLTDSGGIQEETTYLSVPCLTLRPNTERPVTIEMGTNRLIQAHRKAIVAAVDDVLVKDNDLGRIPALWDGRTAERIIDVIRSAEWLSSL